MQPQTGAIAWFENEDDAKKAGHTIPLEKKLAEQLLQVSRAERLERIVGRSAMPASVNERRSGDLDTLH